MMKLTTAILTFLGVIAVAFGLSILLAYPVKWLWNSTLPELFSFKEIGVWMAWKISVLCALLFQSVRYSSK